MATCPDSLRQPLRYLIGLAGLMLWIIGVLFVYDALVAPVFSNVASPTSPTPEQPHFQTLLITSGIVILDPERGYVSFCTNTFLSGAPPIPQGQCTKIGSVGISSLEFVMMESSANNFFIVNKTTQNIFQCVTTPSQYVGAPTGECKQIGNIQFAHHVIIPR